MEHFIGPDQKNFIKEKTFYSTKLKTFDVVYKEVSDIDTIDDYKKLIAMYKKKN
jgi:CMP-N-acetylneuraminic acid synthetase